MARLQAVLDRVGKAVVKFPETGGFGVLVNNHFIITAAHCVSWDCDGSIVMPGGSNYYFAQKIEIDDQAVLATPCCIEPIMDIAVLGPFDNQNASPQRNAFLAACKGIKPVKICKKEFKPFRRFKVFIFTHDKGWIEGTITQDQYESPSFMVRSEVKIEGGTSGGSVINGKGELIGIISNSAETPTNASFHEAVIARPNHALPSWIYKRIMQPE